MVAGISIDLLLARAELELFNLPYFLPLLPLKFPHWTSQLSWFADSDNALTSSGRYLYYSPVESNLDELGQPGTEALVFVSLHAVKVLDRLSHYEFLALFARTIAKASAINFELLAR